MKNLIIAILGLFLALPVLLALPVHGQTIDGQAPVSASYVDFSGGLNDYQAPMYIAKNESPDLMNVVIDEPLGTLAQRKGYLTCGNTPSGNTATNLYNWTRNDGSQNLIVTDNISVWQTSDCNTYVLISTGLSALALPHFATVQDKLWIVNGSTYPIVWDGSTASSLDGTSNKPLAPRAKYMVYWKSRIFFANTPTDPSAVQFTQLTDDDGNVLDPSVSTSAYNSLNVLYINRGDGSPIYGLHLYKDNLYVFKETGVNRIVFESEYNVQIGKNVTTVGCKFNDAIVEMDDGLLRYVGRDGVYAFDGSTVKRLSTRWTPIFESIKQPTRNEQYKLWDSDIDFNNGIFSNSRTLGDSLSIYADISSGSLFDNFSSIKSTWVANSGTFSSLYGRLHENSATVGSVSAYSSTPTASFGIWTYSHPYLRDCANELVFISNSYNPNSTSGYSVVAFPGSGSTSISLYRIDNGAYSIMDSTISVNPNGGTRSFKIVRDNSGIFNVYFSTGTNFDGDGDGVPWSKILAATDTTHVFQSKYLIFKGVKPASNSNLAIDNIYLPVGYSSGVFTSQISTATGLSLWKTFDTDQTLNGQTITYQIRTGATPAAVSAAAWRDISPGIAVSTTTEGYAQWKAAFRTTDNSVSPLLNSASIGWITGDTTISAITAINYKSRYWMAASTATGNQYNDLVMVESKSPIGTHTRYDLPISAMAIWNNNLYGSIGNTAKIARLDYGSTDDGAAITSYWTTRDEMFDSPYYYKAMNWGILDYANTPANTNLQIGISPDMGETYQYRPVNISASTLPRNTKKLNYDANRTLSFRAKISNSVPGIGFKVYGLHLFGKQSGFAGN